MAGVKAPQVAVLDLGVVRELKLAGGSGVQHFQ